MFNQTVLTCTFSVDKLVWVWGFRFYVKYVIFFNSNGLRVFMQEDYMNTTSQQHMDYTVSYHMCEKLEYTLTAFTGFKMASSRHLLLMK